MKRKGNEQMDDQNLDIGQHWLTDESVLSVMTDHVQRGAKVLEICAGKGQLTRKIAPIAKEVVAVEIDKRYFRDLEAVASQQHNVRVIISDALRLNFRDYSGYQVVGNLAYNIVEPLITRLAGSPIKSATLMVGQSFADEATGDGERTFGKLGMLVKTFFHAHSVATISKRSFDPPPRTESAILELTPRDKDEFKDNRALFVERELFASASHSPKIQSVMREALIRHANETRGVLGMLTGSPVLTKNQAREIVESLGIPANILERPIEQLSNSGLFELDAAIRTHLK